MSEQNVEIVRQQNEALNRGDLAEVLERCDPDVDWWDRVDDPGATVHRGHEGIGKMMAEVAESLVGLRVEPKEFIDAGDYIVVPVRVIGHGRVSGASFEEHEVQVFKLRDGRIVEIREYREKHEALAAVGPIQGAR